MLDIHKPILEGCLTKNMQLLCGLDKEEVRLCRDKRGASSLHYAVRGEGGSEQEAILEHLVWQCASSVHVQANNGARPLHDACATGNGPAVSWLLSNTDCCVQDADNNGILAVHLVARFGHLSILEMLVKHGNASLHVKTSTGARPLHFAAAAGHFNIVRFILENTASFQNDDEKHRDYGDSDCPCCKLDHIVNVQMESGATPLYLASQNGNLETVQHLINIGNASVKILTRDGMSCLHAAAQSGHLKIVEWLVDQQKVGLDIKDLDGLTALHYASGNGQVHVVEWLLAQGAQLMRDFVGGSPLHTAAHNGSTECALTLLNGGCNPLSEDLNGLTALDIAAKCGHFGFAGCITKWQRQRNENLRKQEPTPALDTSRRCTDTQPNYNEEENDYENIHSASDNVSIPPPPSYPPPEVPEITRLKRQERVEENHKDASNLPGFRAIAMMTRLSSQNSKDTESGESKPLSPESPDPTSGSLHKSQFNFQMETRMNDNNKSRSRTNSFKALALTARSSFEKKAPKATKNVADGSNHGSHVPNKPATDTEQLFKTPEVCQTKGNSNISTKQRVKINSFKAVAKLTKLSAEIKSQSSEDREDVEVCDPVSEKHDSEVVRTAGEHAPPKRANSLKMIAHIRSLAKKKSVEKPEPPQPESAKDESATIDQSGGNEESSRVRGNLLNTLNEWVTSNNTNDSTNKTLGVKKPKNNEDTSMIENDDQSVGGHILSQLSNPDLRLSLRKAKSQAKGQSMMFFGAPSSTAKDTEKFTSTVLTGEFDPKNFLHQVPNIDTTGNELPPWKKMLIAKQMAEKEYQKAMEKKQKEQEELKYKDMPVWKKVIMQKRDNERNLASGQESENQLKKN